MEYRSERKYLIKAGQMEILKARIRGIMAPDRNMRQEGVYNIRSIYFDDYYDSYLQENEAGVNERMKIRIRIYDRSPELIRTELKYKLNGQTRKESCPIDRALCGKIIAGREISLSDCHGDKVLNRVYLEMKTRCLRPKVIVEYDRTAFVNRTGNVRVTFDQNIRASAQIERFFSESAYPVPVLDVGEHVLEVKHDELLPDYISQALELNELSQTSFSKYYLSRMRLEELRG